MTGEILCIIPGPRKEIRRRAAGDKWCFGCRRRLPHDLVVLADEEPSWYEPMALYECSGCKRDRTDFPS